MHRVPADRSTTSRQLARRIRLLRVQRGWSAKQLADRCERAGAASLTRGTIAKIESGTRQSITADEVVVLADILDVTPTHLLAVQSDAEAFLEALLNMHRRAGSPSIDELAEKAEIHSSTLSDWFRGATLPDWQKLEQVTKLLDGDIDRMRDIWRRAAEGEAERLIDEVTAPPVGSAPSAILEEISSVESGASVSTDLQWVELLEGLQNPGGQADPAKENSFALTRLFLEVGLKMADEDLGHCGGPAFGWRQISRERVVSRAVKLGSDIDWGEVGSGIGAFRSRWRRMADYLQDLVTYALYSPRWREALEFAKVELLAGLDDVANHRRTFSDLILAVAKKDMILRLRFARYLIFQLTLTVDSAYSRVAYEAHTRFYERYSESWAAAYHEALKKLGLKLRPGVTIDVLSKLFGSLAQGLTMIAADTGDNSLTNDANGRPLLANGVMLMILGAIDRGDGRSIEDCIDLQTR